MVNIEIGLEKFTINVCTLARKTGNFLREERKQFSMNAVEVKGTNNFVSYVDKQAEKQIVDGLKNLLPEAGFIAEEGTAQSNDERYRWVIDPLDGTTNFIHGLYPFAVSIALMDGEQAIIGVIYEVGLDECFYAWSGSKAYCNGSEITVSEAPAVKDSLIATGFPYTDFGKFEKYINSLQYLLKNSHGARRLGSAATDLAYVACGRCDSFYEYSLSPWDVAAGALIVQQAGGKVSDFAGGSSYIFGKEIVATNAKTYDEFMKIVKTYF
ncbi:MAG: inositol monophosphatase [Prevotellaceae bacterium]|jgi:myo-inositol-1(or 4)-monophosphatase|nr:inositol monophosphatase [Prevotellaceae bacterium]